MQHNSAHSNFNPSGNPVTKHQ